mmetsp:Transcript_39385/g.37861  ORF Transcript_39385/g.37861 Transcript_39385/m.37861 type:complete len:158 (+) Transcript_39385:274-747(+)
MFQFLFLLFHGFLFDLVLSPHLSLDQFLLLLISRLHLLLLNHFLRRSVFDILLLFDFELQFFLLSLFHLHIVHFLLHFIIFFLFSDLQIHLHLILVLLIKCLLHLLLLLLLSLSLDLFFHVLLVPLLLTHNVLSSFLSLINLFPSLLFFLFEKSYSV